jgi:hypothetical protein
MCYPDEFGRAVRGGFKLLDVVGYGFAYAFRNLGSSLSSKLKVSTEAKEL